MGWLCACGRLCVCLCVSEPVPVPVPVCVSLCNVPFQPEAGDILFFLQWVALSQEHRQDGAYLFARRLV